MDRRLCRQGLLLLLPLQQLPCERLVPRRDAHIDGGAPLRVHGCDVATETQAERREVFCARLGGNLRGWEGGSG